MQVVRGRKFSRVTKNSGYREPVPFFTSCIYRYREDIVGISYPSPPSFNRCRSFLHSFFFTPSHRVRTSNPSFFTVSVTLAVSATSYRTVSLLAPTYVSYEAASIALRYALSRSLSIYAPYWFAPLTGFAHVWIYLLCGRCLSTLYVYICTFDIINTFLLDAFFEWIVTCLVDGSFVVVELWKKFTPKYMKSLKKNTTIKN